MFFDIFRLLEAFWRKVCGSKDSAESLVSRAKADIQPAQASVEFRTGLQLAVNGDHAGALSQFEKVLAVSPESAVTYYQAAKQALLLGDTVQARDFLMLALYYDPGDRMSALLMAQLHISGKDFGQARMLLEKFLRSEPTDRDLCFELARCEYLSGEFDRGVILLEELLKSHPDDPSALNFLGLITAREFGKLVEGERYIRRAIELSPRFSPAWSNLGWVRSEQGDLTQAIQIFDRVLELDGTDSETRLMRAHSYLKHAHFESGWTDFESRHASPLAIRSKWSLPLFPRDKSPAGQRILVHAEQGLGDQIMFASCVPDLVSAGADVTVECDSRLKPLFTRSFLDCKVVCMQDLDAESRSLDQVFDYQIAIGSLPGIFRNRVEQFPSHQGYLRADLNKVGYWRDKLKSLGPGPYVGLSWRGGAKSTRQQLRSVPLHEWMPVLRCPMQFVSLQYGECASDIEGAARAGLGTLHHWPDAISDYDETAALVCALDLVISVCTAVVHLSGALGRNVYVVTPFQAEWRYLFSGSTLPWYPQARLFRQGPGESWGGVMKRIADFLSDESDKKRQLFS